MPNIIDLMIAVPDSASIVAARRLAGRTGRRFGPSTGTNLIGALSLAAQMHAQEASGSFATLACDAGDRYADTIYDDSWLAAKQLDLADWPQRIRDLAANPAFGHDLLRSPAEI